MRGWVQVTKGPRCLMSRPKRIAIYGGTFDPVHVGHLDVARQITRLFEIDELLFAPARVAPHKLARDVTASIHRYAMLVLATQDDPRFYVTTFELEAADRRYTVDTLSHFQTQLGASADLFFIMGADSWSEITTWRHWERLLEMTNHIVVTRPGYKIDLGVITPTLRERVVDLRGEQFIPPREGERIFITDAVMRQVSATEIRRAVRSQEREKLDELVPPAVAHYITKYHLYQDSNEA